MSRARTGRGRDVYVPLTEKMMRYMLNLAREREWPAYGGTADERVAFLQREVDTRRLSKYGAMDVIDRLKAAPLATEPDVVVEPGVYRRNGAVYVVQWNRARTARYAKRLVEIGGRRLLDADGETVVKADFEYAPGALQTLRPSDQLTLEQAREYLVRYTHCMICGRPLKDATSVADTIGPVCRRMFRSEDDDDEPDPAVVEAQSSALDELLAQLGGAS